MDKFAPKKNFVAKWIIAGFVGAAVNSVAPGNSLGQDINFDPLIPTASNEPTEGEGAIAGQQEAPHENQTPPEPLVQRGNFPSYQSEAAPPTAQTPPSIESPTQEGEAPNLRTQPTAPQDQRFVPTRIPFRPKERQQQYRASPGITAITPSAYGKSWGNAGIGLGLQERTRYTDTADGVAGIGFGLGDAGKAVGLDIGVSITDLVEDTAKDGTISFKLHRRLPQDLAIAVGVQNVVNWGETDGGTSIYGVVTKRFSLTDNAKKPFSQLYVSAGIGNGQFRSESNIQNDVDSVGFFGSVALRVAQPVNLLVEWTGQDLTIGLPFVPSRKLPLVITPALTDITGSAGDGVRFTVGIGYGFSFK